MNQNKGLDPVGTLTPNPHKPLVVARSFSSLPAGVHFGPSGGKDCGPVLPTLSAVFLGQHGKHE